MKMLHPKSGQGYTERLVSEVQKKKKNQSLKIFGVMDDVKCKGNL
jgi:hypothetical protein